MWRLMVDVKLGLAFRSRDMSVLGQGHTPAYAITRFVENRCSLAQSKHVCKNIPSGKTGEVGN